MFYDCSFRIYFWCLIFRQRSRIFLVCATPIVAADYDYVYGTPIKTIQLYLISQFNMVLHHNIINFGGLKLYIFLYIFLNYENKRQKRPNLTKSKLTNFYHNFNFISNLKVIQQSYDAYCYIFFWFKNKYWTVSAASCLFYDCSFRFYVNDGKMYEITENLVT